MNSSVDNINDERVQFPNISTLATNDHSESPDRYVKTRSIFEQENIQNKLPVLLVEDDTITQEVIKLFLHDRFIIDLAVNAEEALKKVIENEYLAVLMDINLGRGLNGVHVTKEIRRLPGKNRIPIVAQTAFAMKGDKEEFFSAGCDYYLAKPFSKEELRSVLFQIHCSRAT